VGGAQNKQMKRPNGAVWGYRLFFMGGEGEDERGEPPPWMGCCGARRSGIRKMVSQTYSQQWEARKRGPTLEKELKEQKKI